MPECSNCSRTYARTTGTVKTMILPCDYSPEINNTFAPYIRVPWIKSSPWEDPYITPMPLPAQPTTRPLDLGPTGIPNRTPEYYFFLIFFLFLGIGFLELGAVAQLAKWVVKPQPETKVPCKPCQAEEAEIPGCGCDPSYQDTLT